MGLWLSLAPPCWEAWGGCPAAGPAGQHRALLCPAHLRSQASWGSGCQRPGGQLAASPPGRSAGLRIGPAGALGSVQPLLVPQRRQPCAAHFINVSSCRRLVQNTVLEREAGPLRAWHVLCPEMGCTCDARILQAKNGTCTLGCHELAEVFCALHRLKHSPMQLKDLAAQHVLGLRPQDKTVDDSAARCHKECAVLSWVHAARTGPMLH